MPLSPSTALHNKSTTHPFLKRGYPHRDPPLTDLGTRQAIHVQQTIKVQPDLIIVSPMTRTIQTMYIVFRYLLHTNNTEIQVWPDLREAHDATCNKGVGRKDLEIKFQNLDFSACPEKWDFPIHTPDDATARAERVRRRLKEIARVGGYKDILLVTHRGIAAFLAKGERFNVCEHRSYRFAADDEVEKERFGVNVDTGSKQDFGPTLLMPVDGKTRRQE
ncbi:hypothetical protein F53441_3663 [Fusarium austroafricanum]|uniref:Phosphoglycerate mutase n=1 Tax=Fusarium austroafricanum TaxID=2364996 RepID=A0A8H4KQB6_9HYPO|nr:hypothetical protein F53441_3663 [Fusarium austroafricanum]